MDTLSKVAKHLAQMYKIGCRPVGSKANHKAAAYIQKTFLECGLTIKEQKFTCPDWHASNTTLLVDNTPLKAEANTFSPSCDVTAPCVPVQTIQELESVVLTDQIALLYGDLTKKSLAPKECKVYNPERDQKIIQLLEDKSPAAIITVAPQRGNVLSVIEDKDFKIPSATVSPGVGLHLLKNTQPVQLKIVSHCTKSCGSNIIGTKGTKERIVMCAHFDTKVRTPGAFDNSSGVAVLLTLAGLLAERSIDVEFVAFNDEEYNGLGDYEYVRCRNDFESIRAAINIDGVGHVLGTHSVTIMENSKAFKKEVSSTKEKYPGIVWVDPWPQSNHSTFSERGVPSIAVSSVGVDVAHSPSDTIEWMDSEKLAEVVLFITDILDAIGNKPLGWFRKAKKTV